MMNITIHLFIAYSATNRAPKEVWITVSEFSNRGLKVCLTAFLVALSNRVSQN